MKTWEVTYTYDRVNFLTEIVEAVSYTKALLEFAIKHPKSEYHIVREVNENECARA